MLLLRVVVLTRDARLDAWLTDMEKGLRSVAVSDHCATAAQTHPPDMPHVSEPGTGGSAMGTVPW